MLCSLKELSLTAEHDYPYAVITPAALLNDYKPLDPEKPSIPADIKAGDKVFGPVVCGKVLKCTSCSVPMVYHKAAHKVLCHYCGSQMEPPTVCPACGGKLQYRGFGTQKAEEELAKLFPDARVLRMDQDSTAAKDAHEKLLARFANHEYDIMVGTQMVA